MKPPRLLIDTNIILDALMQREPWANAAQSLILAVAQDRAAGYITASSFTDIHYLLRKHQKDKALTKQSLRKLLVIISVLDVNGVDCEKTFDIPINDYEDALLACCGQRHKVDFIITRNLKDFTNSPIKAIGADAILKKLI
ncbi:MAG: PIN domain-containing protein [Defluviitaleaceae bacterium]|nr:PIN domain-containing protein [Defluviitaleaceae bacterium]